MRTGDGWGWLGLASAVVFGCGGEAKHNQSAESATAATNTTGISIGGLTSNVASSAVTASSTATSVGGGVSGGVDTGIGGTGGSGGCGPAAPQLGACYGVAPGAAGEGGGGGGGGGGSSNPVAVIDISGGDVKITPINDSTRIALSGLMFMAWVSFWLFLTVRTISHESGKTRRESLKKG